MKDLRKESVRGSQGEKPDARTAHHWGEKLVNVPSRGGYLTELVTGRPTGHCGVLHQSSRNHTDSWKNSPVWVRGLYGSKAPSWACVIAYRGYAYWKIKLRVIMEQEKKSLVKKLERVDERFSDVADICVGLICKALVIFGITICALIVVALLIMLVISTYSEISSRLF